MKRLFWQLACIVATAFIVGFPCYVGYCCGYRDGWEVGACRASQYTLRHGGLPSYSWRQAARDMPNATDDEIVLEAYLRFWPGKKKPDIIIDAGNVFVLNDGLVLDGDKAFWREIAKQEANRPICVGELADGIFMGKERAEP